MEGWEKVRRRRRRAENKAYRCHCCQWKDGAACLFVLWRMVDGPVCLREKEREKERGAVRSRHENARIAAAAAA